MKIEKEQTLNQIAFHVLCSANKSAANFIGEPGKRIFQMIPKDEATATFHFTWYEATDKLIVRHRPVGWPDTETIIVFGPFLSISFDIEAFKNDLAEKAIKLANDNEVTIK